MRALVFALVIALATAFIHDARAQAPARSDLRRKLQPCLAPGVVDSVLCGHFEVAEVPDAADARRIPLNIMLLPATTDSVVEDPLVFLAGGGVVPATRYARFLARALPALRVHRDILLVDQRGTWNSNALACAGDSAASGLPDLSAMDMRQCLAELVQRADLRAYNTSVAMDDLDHVRDWLGYPRVNLYGVSYGTKAAQVYLKQYPERVRSAVLYGVVPLSAPTQLDLARSADRSLAEVFARCAADSACQAAFPQVASEFDSTLARLARAPALWQAKLADGSIEKASITDRMVRDLVQTMLGTRRGIEHLPMLIHAAYGGDFGPIAAGVLGEGPAPPPPAPRGVFFSILCSEAIPLVDPDRVAAATAGTFFGSTPVKSQLETCASWPRAELPASFWEPARASVPVLAVSGDLDPITPPSYGELVTSTLPQGRHVVVPNRSHGDVDPCLTGIFEQFLIAGSWAALDTTCLSAPAPLRFLVDSQSQ